MKKQHAHPNQIWPGHNVYVMPLPDSHAPRVVTFGLRGRLLRLLGVQLADILQHILCCPQNHEVRNYAPPSVRCICAPAEQQKNAQTARHLEVGLPAELDKAAQIDLVRGYVQKHFVDRGMCADICVHDKNPRAQ